VRINVSILIFNLALESTNTLTLTNMSFDLNIYKNILTILQKDHVFNVKKPEIKLLVLLVMHTVSLAS